MKHSLSSRSFAHFAGGILLTIAGGMASNSMSWAAPGAEPLRFDRDILPILADNCFACHGPDAGHREADLRLDTAEGAMADRDGVRAVAPGNPQASELITRLHSTDPDVVMPPPDSHKLLTDDQKWLLHRWIIEGAPYDTHWAYRPLTRPSPPAEGHPIDAFIEARLAAEGIRAESPTDRVTLIRRV